MQIYSSPSCFQVSCARVASAAAALELANQTSPGALVRTYLDRIGLLAAYLSQLEANAHQRRLARYANVLHFNLPSPVSLPLSTCLRQQQDTDGFPFVIRQYLLPPSA